MSISIQEQFNLIQEQTSMRQRFIQAQMDYPVKGDWTTKVIGLIQEFGLNLALWEIKSMPKFKYQNLVRKKVKQKAFSDLILKQQEMTKGVEIKYEVLKIKDYLLSNNLLSLEQQNKKNVH